MDNKEIKITFQGLPMQQIDVADADTLRGALMHSCFEEIKFIQAPTYSDCSSLYESPKTLNITFCGLGLKSQGAGIVNFSEADYESSSVKEYPSQFANFDIPIVQKSTPGILGRINVKKHVGNYTETLCAAQVFYPNIINLLVYTDKLYNARGSYQYKVIESVNGIIGFLCGEVLPDALSMLNGTFAEFEQRCLVQQHSSLITDFANRFAEEANASVSSLEKSYRELENAEAKVASIQNTIKTKEDALMHFESNARNTVVKIMQECERIKSISQVTSVDISNLHAGLITFETDNIYVKCQGRRFYVGRYQVSFNIKTHNIQFINMEESLRRRSHWGNECQHPHVNSYGRACAGNIGNDFKDALKNFEYAFLAILCISYLQSVNIDDAAGKNILNWPVVDDDGVIIEDSVSSFQTCATCGSRLPSDSVEFNEEVITCPVCGDLHHKRCCTCIEGTDIYVCKSCYSLGALPCSKCGEIKARAELVEDAVTKRMICRNHATEVTLAINNKMILDTYTAYIDSDSLESIRECAHCGRKFLSEEESDLCFYCQNADGLPAYCDVCEQLLPHTDLMDVTCIDGQHKICVSCYISDIVFCSESNAHINKRDCARSEDDSYDCTQCQYYNTERDDNND